MVGSTGAVWIDADGDGRRTSAFDYARRLVQEAAGDVTKLVLGLAAYDEAVASQVAGLLRGERVSDAELAARLGL